MNILNSDILNIDVNQKTINSVIYFHGVGIHSGKAVNMKLIPAQENFGIIFKRVDLEKDNLIKVDVNNIENSRFCSKLKNNKGVFVSTIEHFLATLHALDINNLLIEINSSELPAMDGSSNEFTNKINEIGIKMQKIPKKIVKIQKTISVRLGERFIKVDPSASLSFTVKINYPNTLIGKDKYCYTHNKHNFLNEICYARTFCMSKDVTKLRAYGYGLGGNLNNAIVVDENKLLNSSGLRCKQEFVKHKVLDCVGDFYMCGLPIIGKFHASEPGHELNNKLLKKIFKNKDNFKIVESNSFQPYFPMQNNILTNINVA